jgi:lysophospholipase L1-like esterase
MVRILVFGASITYGACDPDGGWVQRLRKHIDSKSDSIDSNRVFNLGIPGDIVEDVLNRFRFEAEQRIRKDDDTVFIFSIGVNDSQFLRRENSLRTGPEEFKENLRKLLGMAGEFSSKMIFVGFPPVDDPRVDPIPWDTNKSYSNKSVQQYNGLAQAVCVEKGVPFIDVFSRLNGSDYMNHLYDGLHPTSEGHRMIFEIVRDFLDEKRIV